MQDPAPACLIVNADDYGYSDGVSLGIIDTARNGIVTATGVLANAQGLSQQVHWLTKVPALDVGVHLNLTHGTPLSDIMRNVVGDRFPASSTMIAALVRNKLNIDVVTAEWRAQIDRCLSLGLTIRFLNSHEHLHMLPRLYSLTRKLAEEYAIGHIRHTRTEWLGRRTPKSALRDLTLAPLSWRTRHTRAPAAKMLGLTESGKLSLSYLTRRLPKLVRGNIYELMCHPGRLQTEQRIDQKLAAYHAWDAERELLCSDAVRGLITDYDIRLIGYRDLKIMDHQLQLAS